MLDGTFFDYLQELFHAQAALSFQSLAEARAGTAFNFTVNSPLNDSQEVELARGHKGSRLTAATRPAGSPHAVHIALGVLGNVKVIDMRDALDI